MVRGVWKPSAPGPRWDDRTSKYDRADLREGRPDTFFPNELCRIASAISLITFVGFWFGGRRGMGGLLAMIIAPIAAAMIQFAVSRAREYQADATGARMIGDPEGLASALAKLELGARRSPRQVSESTAHLYIVNPFAGLKTRSLFSTHPPVEDRIERLSRMNI